MIGSFLSLPTWVGDFALSASAQTKTKQVDQLKKQQQSIESQAEQLRRKKQENQQKARYHESQLVRKQRELYRTRSKLNQQQLFLAGTSSELVRLETELDKTIGETTRLQSTAAQRLRSAVRDPRARRECPRYGAPPRARARGAGRGAGRCAAPGGGRSDRRGGIVFQAVKAFRWAPYMSKDWEERKIKEFMEEEEQSNERWM